MCILVLCLRPKNLLDPNPAFATFAARLTTSPVVERLVFAKVCRRRITSFHVQFVSGVW